MCSMNTRVMGVMVVAVLVGVEGRVEQVYGYGDEESRYERKMAARSYERSRSQHFPTNILFLKLSLL